MTTDTPIAVLGAGSWGTALAMLLSRNGRPTLLWSHDSVQVQDLARTRRNAHYLPGIDFPPALEPHADLEVVLQRARDLLVAVPSSAFRSLLERLAPGLGPEQRMIWATKGLEPGTGRLLHQVAADVLGTARPLAVVSGPTFAREVALGLPTAVTIAAQDEEFANELAARFHDENFRTYTSTDLVGVQLGGAVKNVLALAAGIADGLGFGANTRAALITRGLAEMMRLGDALGGQRETFMGLTGLGDLVLTCTDDQSRNRRAGLALGRGTALSDALAAIGQVVEGVGTAREVYGLARARGVDMPITEQVYRVLYEEVAPRAAVHALLGRQLKAETL